MQMNHVESLCVYCILLCDCSISIVYCRFFNRNIVSIIIKTGRFVVVVIFLNALGATTWAYYIRKRWFREGFFGKNTFILLCEIFLFNQVAQINRSMYKSDIEEDEECRGIYVILHVKVHGLKFEKSKRCPQQSCICLCLVLCSEQSNSLKRFKM